MTEPGGETLILTPKSYIQPLPLEELFGAGRRIEVELGAGDGSFLAAWAKAHPEIQFLGIERLLGRLRKIDRKAKRAGLRNLRLVRIEASYLVDYLLPPESVAAFHIYFPDPWPKRRHWKNRLITEGFTHSLRKRLRPGGIVYLRTDNEDYFRQMVESFAANPDFEKIETPAHLLAAVTDFEREFHKKGIPTLEAAYRRK